MEFDFKVIGITILIILGIWYLISSNELKENEYKVEINDPYTICGEKVYFTDDANGKEISISRIIDTIEYNCKVVEMETLLDEYGLTVK